MGIKTSGSIHASKIVLPAGGDILVGDDSLIDEIKALSGLDATELGYLDGATAGTVVAEKAVVVDVDKDAAGFRTVSGTGSAIFATIQAGESGTAGAVKVYPSTAASGDFEIQCADQAGNTTVTMQVAQMGQATIVTLEDPGVAASHLVQSTAALTLAEVDTLDVSAQTETIDSGAVVSVTKAITNIDNTTLGAGAITIAAPDAVMLGRIKVIKMTVDNGDVTMVTTNILGATGGATGVTFNDVGDAIYLIGGVGKWIFVAVEGATLTGP